MIKCVYLLVAIVLFLQGCATKPPIIDPPELNIEVLATIPDQKDPLVYILDLDTRQGKFYHRNTSVQNWMITEVSLGFIVVQNKSTQEIRTVVWSDRAKKWAGR